MTAKREQAKSEMSNLLPTSYKCCYWNTDNYPYSLLLMTQGSTATSFDALKVNQYDVRVLFNAAWHFKFEPSPLTPNLPTSKKWWETRKKSLWGLIRVDSSETKAGDNGQKSIKARFEFGKSLATPHQPIEAVSPLHWEREREREREKASERGNEIENERESKTELERVRERALNYRII